MLKTMWQINDLPTYMRADTELVTISSVAPTDHGVLMRWHCKPARGTKFGHKLSAQRAKQEPRHEQFTMK